MAGESDKGTDKEKLEQEALVQDEIFNDAFDAAEKGIGLPDSSTAQSDQAGKDADKQNADSADGDGHGDSSAKDTSGDGTDKPASSSTSDKSSSQDTSTQTTKDDEQTYEQRWKSLNGILKSTNEKFDAEKSQLLSEMDALKKKVDELSKAKGDKDAADKSKVPEEDLTDEQKKLLESYDAEFDTVSKMEGIKREKAIKALEKKLVSELESRMASLQDQFQTKVKPIEDNINKSEREAHFGAIRSAHEDFEKYRDDGSILKWIESKPAYLQGSMKQTYAKGKAADVIELITDYKRDNGLIKDNDSTSNVIDAERLKQEREKKKQELTSVPTRRTAINSSRSVADDYDSAFDEATKR